MKLITAFFAAIIAFTLAYNVAASTATTAKRAADIVQKEIGKMENLLSKLKTDMEKGNIPLTLAPGAPGGSSYIAKFLARLWRGSRREGGLWFTLLDTDGWIGYYDGATDDDKTYTFLQKSTTPGNPYGDRLFYKYDSAMSPGGMPLASKTKANFNYKGKPWFAQSGCADYKTNPAACQPAWVAQISASSNKLNYYYTVPTSYDGNLFGIGLSGRTVNTDFDNALKQFHSDDVQAFVAYEKTGYLARSDNKTSVNTAAKRLYGKSDTDTNQNNVYKAFVDKDAGYTTTATVGGVIWTPTIIDLPMGINSNLTIVVASKNANCDSTCRDNVAKGAKAAMETLLNPLVNDLNALKAECESGSIPRTYPNEVPGTYQRIQRYFSTAWHQAYRVGGMWMGWPNGGYIGYAASKSDFNSKVSQYTYIAPKPWNTNCSAATLDGISNSAVSSGLCRRWYKADEANMPTTAYKQRGNYYTIERDWYTACVKVGKPAWTFLIGTTTGLPSGNYGVPIMKDNEVKAVAIGQLDFGADSTISTVLKSFVSDDKNLFLYVVDSEGGLVSTSGDDTGYYSSTEKNNDGSQKMTLLGASTFSKNEMIQTTAKVIRNRFGFPGTYTAGKYNAAVFPLNSEITGNIGWSVVAVSEKYPLDRTKYEACKARRLIGSERALAAKAPCLKTNKDGSKCLLTETDSVSTTTKKGLGGGWITLIVIGSLAFIGGLVYTGNKFANSNSGVRTMEKQSIVNPAFAASGRMSQELPAVASRT